MLLISFKHVFSKGDKCPSGIGSRIYVSSIRGHGKFKQHIP
jgi:hypothetical protein